jgi:hypothetical protein
MCALVLFGAATAQAAPPEVERQEVLRLGNHVQLIDGHRSAADDAFVNVMGPPADDNQKWFVTVISTKGCGACTRLKSDLATSPYLRALVNADNPKESWSHFNAYLNEDRSQQFRWQNIKLGGFPTILVQPPLNKKYGDPATVVFQQTGYDGNGQRLAAKITAAIKTYLSKRVQAAPHRPAGHRQQVPVADGDPIGVDPPWTPPPKVDPPVGPTPSPSPHVDIPVIPPVDVPTPNTDDRVSTYPEAIVVTDADDGLDGPIDDRIRSVLAALRIQRGKNLKVRLMDWREAKDRYPVRRDEVPVILVTNDGRIEDKISGKLLPFLQTQPREVTLADIPWSAILTLVTTGFSLPAAIAIGLWAVRFIRARRQAAGKPLLLSDEALEQVVAVIAKFLESRLPKPPAPTP